MSSRSSQNVIEFKKRPSQDSSKDELKLTLKGYSSSGIVEINPKSSVSNGRSLPLLESLHRRRLTQKGSLLLQGTRSSFSASDDELSCIQRLNLSPSDNSFSTSEGFSFTAYESGEYDAVERFANLREKLNWLRQNGSLCDVTVQLGNSHQNFAAHSAILAAGSKFCRELMDRILKGNGKNKRIEKYTRESEETEKFSVENEETEIGNGESEEIEIGNGESEVIKKVSGESEVIKKVSGESEEIEIVGGESEVIKKVSGESEEIEIVSGEGEEVEIVSGESEEIEIVSGESEEIETVSGESEEIEIVSGESEKIEIVSGESEEIVIVSGESEETKKVSGESEETEKDKTSTEAEKSNGENEEIEQGNNVHEETKKNNGKSVGIKKNYSKSKDTEKCDGMNNDTVECYCDSKSNEKANRERKRTVKDCNDGIMGDTISRNGRKSASWLKLNPYVIGSESDVVMPSKQLFPFAAKSDHTCKEMNVERKGKTLKAKSATTFDVDKDLTASDEHDDRQRNDFCWLSSESSTMDGIVRVSGTYFESAYVVDWEDSDYVIMSPQKERNAYPHLLLPTNTFELSKVALVKKLYMESSIKTSRRTSGNKRRKEMKTSEKRIVLSIDGVYDPVIFELILGYIYTGTFHDLQTLPVNKFREIEELAKMLQVDGVDVFSPEVMRQAINSQNLLQFWNLAEERDDDALRKVALEFISNHLSNRKLMNTLKSQLIHRKRDVVTSAKTRLKKHRRNALRALLGWANQWPENRRRFLVNVLPEITSNLDRTDFVDEFLRSDSYANHLSPILLKQLRGRNLLTNKWSSSEKLLCEAAIPDCLLCKRKSSASSRRFSRPAHRLISRVLVEKKPSPLRGPIQLKMVCTESNEICGLAPPTERLPRGSITWRKCILDASTKIPDFGQRAQQLVPVSLSRVPCIAVLGKQSSLRTLFMMKFSQFGQLLDEASLDANVDEGKPNLTMMYLYNFAVIAACDDEYMPIITPLTNWQVDIDATELAWELRLPALRPPRRCFKAFLVGSTLYLCGGEVNPAGYLANVDALNLNCQRENWSKMKSMLHRRAGHSVACTDDGSVFVVGGGTNRCEYFDVKAEKWNEIAPLPWKFSHCDVHVFVVDQNIFAMSSFRPLCIYVLDKYMRSWEQQRLSGKPPAEVVSTTVCLGKVYVLSHKTIYYFKILDKEWCRFAKIERSNFEPLFLCSWEMPAE